MLQNNIQIIPFSEAHKEAIKILNYEWLEKFFRVEDSDIRTLCNPEEEIIGKGGFIFYAELNGEIVGTASLLRKDSQIFELGKMAVAEKAQGHKIGTFLLEHCLKFAREKDIKTLILYSNTQLKSALHLYRKYGFTEVEMEKGLYERADIKMEKRL